MGSNFRNAGTPGFDFSCRELRQKTARIGGISEKSDVIFKSGKGRANPGEKVAVKREAREWGDAAAASGFTEERWAGQTRLQQQWRPRQEHSHKQRRPGRSLLVQTHGGILHSHPLRRQRAD